MVVFKKWALFLGLMILLAYTMPMTPYSLSREMLDTFSPSSNSLWIWDMTRLKINFHKSCVYNLYRDGEVGTRAVSILNCNLSSLAFIYLGLSIKAIALTRDDWQRLIKRVEKRPAIWKGNTLSWESRLILLNSVLSLMTLFHIFLLSSEMGDSCNWLYSVCLLRKGTRNIHGVCASQIENLFALVKTKVAWLFAIFGLPILLS